jgi:hypothetical protein
MAFVARACDQLSSHCEDQCSLYTLRHPSGTWQVGVLTGMSYLYFSLSLTSNGTSVYLLYAF